MQWLSRRRESLSSRRCSFFLLTGLMLSLLGGCSAQPKPSDGEQAGTVLRSALNAWQEGKSIDDMKALSPPIYVGDVRWQRGRKLIKYDIKSEGDNMQTSVNFKVALLLDKDSKPTEVVYYVSTNPAQTVTAAE